MNERPITDNALDDQLRRPNQDVYQPIESASQVGDKLSCQPDEAPPKKSMLATRSHLHGYPRCR
jgi:hypothetical protein